MDRMGNDFHSSDTIYQATISDRALRRKLKSDKFLVDKKIIEETGQFRLVIPESVTLDSETLSRLNKLGMDINKYIIRVPF